MKIISSAKELLRLYSEGERDFQGVQLRDSNLANANLQGARFDKADLTNSDLSGAKLKGAAFLWADLSNCDLTGVQIDGTSFRGTNLSGSRCSNTFFVKSNISAANFQGADLTRANLAGEILHGTCLNQAQLQGAILVNAKLVSVELIDADFNGARLGTSELSNLDLGPFCRAKLEHVGPSTVDYRSIVRSLSEPALPNFLRDCGMPQIVIDQSLAYAVTLAGGRSITLLQSTFISYGQPDEAFAQRLNEALKHEGVQTFFYPDDATFGERNRTVMHQGVNEYDRIVLVCSKNSLERKGVQVEIQESLDREIRDGGRLYLIPITLDDYVFSWNGGSGGPELALKIRDRVVGDFRGTDIDQKRFREQLGKLVRALKKTEAAEVR